MNATATYTAEQIIEQEAARSREWERTTKHGPFYVAELRAAFETICKAAGLENWKRPGAAYVKRESLHLYRAAVAYFCGSRLVEDDVYGADGRNLVCRVTWPGYQAS